MVTCVWFKRDLRTTDHAALAQAAANGTVLPLYIVEPDYWALPDTSARQWAFIRETLTELDNQLSALGAPLVVRVGDAISVLQDVQRQTGFQALISHEETGNAWTYRRDRAVAVWARRHNIVWTQLPQCGVVRRLQSRAGWARQRDQFMAEPIAAPPTLLTGTGLPTETLPTGTALGMRPDPCRGRQIGGRSCALALLDSFLTKRGRGYRRAMSSPLDGAEACSRLSPHLAVGAVSTREVVQAAARASRPDATWRGAIKAFEARLAWRDHFTQKLEDQPSLEHDCLHRAYEGLRPRPGDPAKLHAWRTGQTGLPFVDACMRALIQTGWLNFRMRSMLMAVASYQLWLDWRDTGPHLARMFLDYEPGIHWPQVQMQSGTTGMNTIRMYNPIKQGLDQDPRGTFTRRWLPELASVPCAHLQAPWAWTGAGTVLGKTYPAPIVDPVKAAKSARDVVWAVRQGPEFDTVAQDLVQRHASRADPKKRFVNDRAKPHRRTRVAALGQTSFKF